MDGEMNNGKPAEGGGGHPEQKQKLGFVFQRRPLVGFLLTTGKLVGAVPLRLRTAEGVAEQDGAHTLRPSSPKEFTFGKVGGTFPGKSAINCVSAHTT